MQAERSESEARRQRELSGMVFLLPSAWDQIPSGHEGPFDEWKHDKVLAGGRWMPTAVYWTGRVLRMDLWDALLGDGLCRVWFLQCTAWVCCTVTEVKKKNMVCLHQEFKKCTFRLRYPPYLGIFMRESLSHCTIAAYIGIGVMVNECKACWSLSCVDYDYHQHDCRGGSNP